MHTTDVKLSAFHGFQPDHHLNNISLFHLIDFMFLFSKSGMPRLIHDLNPRFENHRDFGYFALVSKVYFQFWNFWNIKLGFFSLNGFYLKFSRPKILIQSRQEILSFQLKFKRNPSNLPNWIQFVQLYSSPKEKSPDNKWCNPNDYDKNA